MEVQILIENEGIIYEPAVLDGIQWMTERKGSPGKLTFTAVNDELLNVTEGNAVKMMVDGQNVFYGYIFTKSRDKEKQVKITCYDQLRYLKNKDTYCYTNKTADQVLTMICDDFNLRYENIESTEFLIQQRSESNKTLFDIIQNALDLTLLNTKKLYVLYDDFGRIALQNIAAMKLNLIIDADTGQNFEYKSTIDSQTYDQIKLTYDNEESGKRDVYLAKDSENINKWGVLQYYEQLQEGEDGASKAEQLLQYYNKKTRNLSVKSAWGDIRVRAGTSLLIRLNLGDIVVNNFMVCEKVTHTFRCNEHTMDLTLSGGEFIE